MNKYLIFSFLFIFSSVTIQAEENYWQKNFGINPTCGEKPFDIKTLSEIAASDDVKDINDFNAKIPEGVMQGFTFVTSSQSLHRGEGDGQVSALWPRVLRFSADAKIIMSYVCHPENKTYNKVEVLYYNDDQDKFETVSYDLSKKSKSDHRVKYNQQSCKRCHSYQNEINGEVSLKPIWQGYSTWSDCKEGQGISVFGGFDDYATEYRMPGYGSPSDNPNKCKLKDYEEFAKKQAEYFKQFKDLQKDNPCFSSLPWPKLQSNEDAPTKNTGATNSKSAFLKMFGSRYGEADKEGLSVDSKQEVIDAYPYRTLSRTPLGNLSVRTNLRITKALSQLNARRIFKQIKASPEYEKLKHLLAAESVGCLRPKEKELYEQILGEKIEIIPNGRKSKLSGVDMRTWDYNPLLFAFGKKIGMEAGDWSLNFNSKDDPAFHSAVYGRGQEREELDIFSIVSGLIFKDVTGNNSFLSDDKYIYGDNYKCIDDINPEISRTRSNRSTKSYGFTCRFLRGDAIEHAINYIPKQKDNCVEKIDLIDEAKNEAVDFKKSIDEILQTGDELAVERGKKLVNNHQKGKCVLCHSPKNPTQLMRLPDDLLFIPSEKNSQEEKEKAKALLRVRLAEGDFEAYLSERVLKGEMPLGSADDLEQNEREDIIRYLNQLAED